jgi:hypothetical protein
VHRDILITLYYGIPYYMPALHIPMLSFCKMAR